MPSELGLGGAAAILCAARAPRRRSALFTNDGWRVALPAVFVLALRMSSCAAARERSALVEDGSETRRRAADTTGAGDERRHIHEISP